MKKLAITWLCYNRPDLSEAMEAQFVDHPDVDFYVIDNASPNVKIQPIKDFVKVVRLEENKYLTGGWNGAMNYLADKYEYVWQMNDDVERVSTEMGLELAKVMDNHPHLQVVTPCFNSPHATFQANPKRKGDIIPLTWVDWCLPMVRSTGWVEVGGMDEDFKSYGADLAICYHYKKKFADPFALVNYLSAHHLVSQTVSKDMEMYSAMCNVDEMNRLLKLKFNVRDWSQML